MEKIIKFLIAIIIISIFYLKISYSQSVAINDNGAAPNSNAILDVDISSNDKGILIPRLTTAQRTGTFDDSFGASEDGLTVYDTDTKCYWVLDGTAWSRFSMGGNSWFLAGNSSTNPANNFIGTTDAQDLVFRTNNIERARIESSGNFGIGTSNPHAKLHVLLSGSAMGQYPGTVATFQQNNATVDWSRISIIGGSAGASLIDFGDADKQDPGSIKFDHTDNYFAFFTNNTDERMRITSSGNVGIMVTDPDETLEVNGSIKMTDGNEGVNKIMVSDANGKASWSNETDGVKTRVIRQINGGTSTEVVLWSHPEGIEVRFDANSETVTVENKTGDTVDDWNVVIYGGAIGYNSIKATNYKNRNIVDGAANDNISFDLGSETGGWFNIIAADQTDEKDGFIIHIVYYSDDLNGTVQYWDN